MRILFAKYFILLFAVASVASDWSQWRGSRRDGYSVEHMVAGSWPAEVKKLWRVSVGEGHSSPVILGSRIFVFTREADHEVARSLDSQTGKVIWRQSYAAPYDVYPGAISHGKGPKSTPVVSGQHLFTLGISGILTCFDISDGHIVWQKNFAGSFPKTFPPFGASMSPLVEGNILIAHLGGHEGGSLIAFDTVSGKEKWVRKGEGPSYSSPVLWRQNGKVHIVGPGSPESNWSGSGNRNLTLEHSLHHSL